MDLIYPEIINLNLYLQWVGPIEDLDAEFDAIDTNSGGQILFTEFVDWALAKNLDIEDDDDQSDDHDDESVKNMIFFLITIYIL